MKTTDDSYKNLYHDLVNRILKGEGYSRQLDRQAAFANEHRQTPLDKLVDKVAHHAYQVTDNDISATKQAGYTEDQLFELIICGAAGQASRQYESGLAALAEAMKKGGSHAS